MNQDELSMISLIVIATYMGLCRSVSLFIYVSVYPYLFICLFLSLSLSQSFVLSVSMYICTFWYYSDYHELNTSTFIGALKYKFSHVKMKVLAQNFIE